MQPVQPPGAFSVVSFLKNNTAFEKFCFEEDKILAWRALHCVSRNTARGSHRTTSSECGNTIVLSATLAGSFCSSRGSTSTVLPSNSTTNEYQNGASSSSEACVVHAEGMSCWTFAKRNRKAQCGIVVAILLFFVLIAAMAGIGNGCDLGCE